MTREHIRDTTLKQDYKAWISFHIYSRDPSKLERARRKILRLRGVIQVEADYMSYILTVAYDPEKATLDQVRKTTGIRY
jgi:tRNA U54 and U55 pseudouridine synthase Pus10